MSFDEGPYPSSRGALLHPSLEVPGAGRAFRFRFQPWYITLALCSLHPSRRGVVGLEVRNISLFLLALGARVSCATLGISNRDALVRRRGTRALTTILVHAGIALLP